VSRLRLVYCRWPVACNPTATPQKEIAITICRLRRAIINCGNDDPDLWGFGGWGEIGAVLWFGDR